MGAAKKGQPVVKPWRKPEYQKKVEWMLRQYPIWRAALDEELAELFPSCVPVYGQEAVSGGGSGTSSTERYGILRAQKRIQVERIERALALLDEQERQLVELRYFQRCSVPKVCLEIHISEGTYKKRRQSALDKVACALNLI